MAQAYIHLEHLRHNLNTIRNHLQPQTQVMAAVKANAYGHGAVAVVRQLEQWGVGWVAVATAQEALELRHAGIQCHILVLTPVHSALYDATTMRALLAQRVRLGIFSMAQLENVLHVAQGEKIFAHLKVDTGLGRLGLPKNSVLELAQKLDQHPTIDFEGIWSHFACADEADGNYTQRQLENFQEVLAALEKRHIQPRLRHTANSAATLAHPQSHFDMVRPGIALYGYPPSEVVRELEPNLKAVMEVQAPVTFVKKIKAGQSLSYNRLWTSSETTNVASIRFGYADGYPRRLSNRATVVYEGQHMPLRGRVCMDQIMVDTGELKIDVGARVTILGTALPADKLAESCDSSAYELLCGIHQRVQRQYGA